MTVTEALFSLNLALLACDHVITGALALAGPRIAGRVFWRAFGVRLPDTPEYTALLKPWGALGMFAGAVGILPILDPQRYVWVLVALTGLLVTRVVYRLRSGPALAGFGLTPRRNLLHVGLILVCLAGILSQIVWIL